jgi:hypothetical protein
MMFRISPAVFQFSAGQFLTVSYQSGERIHPKKRLLNLVKAWVEVSGVGKSEVLM